jgi:gamma-glutamyl:cysteine ligase YbdK (ATP-grasp superfamily)
MGTAIEREHFEDDDYERFGGRLEACLEALRAVVARPGFGQGPVTIGSELELHLVDRDARAMPVNRAVLAETVGRSTTPITLEIDRFNLEINTAPLPLAGAPFTALKAQLEGALREVRRAAAMHDARIATVGILPTLREADLDSSAITETCRYKALSRSIRRLRGEPFHVAIRGDDALDLVAHDVALEGASAAFQVHLKVAPERFADVMNAAQIACAATLACSTNSPLFLGRRLWEETRVALFRQAVDERREAWRPARVTFGHGWVRDGVVELFEEAVRMHEPLLPVLAARDPREAARTCTGEAPKLEELRLHQSTTWRWNRAVYDDADGGHLRVEMRAMPSGPSVTDMVANAAFAIGATTGLAGRIGDVLGRMTFGHARQNFYEAARFGLGAVLLWPADAAPSPRPRPARDVVLELLPLARAALLASEVDASEVDTWLAVIERRVAHGLTGARWQRESYDALVQRFSPEEAAARMLERYMALSENGQSVAEWPTEHR